MIINHITKAFIGHAYIYNSQCTVERLEVGLTFIHHIPRDSVEA